MTDPKQKRVQRFFFVIYGKVAISLPEVLFFPAPNSEREERDPGNEVGLISKNLFVATHELREECQ